MKDHVHFVVGCNTQGIRMAKGDMLETMHYRFQPFDITTKIFGAWWYFLRQIGIDTKQMLTADYTPIHFSIENVLGHVYDQSHMPVDRFTGAGKPDLVWYEKKWNGSFNLEVRFEDKPGLSQIVRGFLRAMADGFIEISRGKIEVEQIPDLPKKKARCAHGHFASKDASTYGGNCKCGAEVDGWAEVPEFWNAY